MTMISVSTGFVYDKMANMHKIFYLSEGKWQDFGDRKGINIKYKIIQS